MARLILVNGPPGVGKSTFARRHADEHPLTLVIDVDGLRASLGGWRDHEDSKLIARSLALALAESHLRAGHDVVVPQYLGRTDFIEALERTAVQAGAAFVELLLLEDGDVVLERFRARRAELAAAGIPHPQDDVTDDAVERVVAEALVRLTEVAAARPGTRVIASDERI